MGVGGARDVVPLPPGRTFWLTGWAHPWGTGVCADFLSSPKAGRKPLNLDGGMAALLGRGPTAVGREPSGPTEVKEVPSRWGLGASSAAPGVSRGILS